MQRRGPIIAGMREFLWLAVLLLPVAARAEVYRCVQDGQVTYTDRPCAKDATPAELPPLNVAAPGKAADLAAEHDRAVQAGKQKRDAADAKFVQEQGEKQARAKQVRQAILDHRALTGMTASELDSALGAPDQRSGENGNERWTYHENDHRLTVTLRDGRVTGISKKENRKQ